MTGIILVCLFDAVVDGCCCCCSFSFFYYVVVAVAIVVLFLCVLHTLEMIEKYFNEL